MKGVTLHQTNVTAQCEWKSSSRIVTSEAYLGPYQTSLMENFYKLYLAVNRFHKNAALEMSGMVLNKYAKQIVVGNGPTQDTF